MLTEAQLKTIKTHVGIYYTDRESQREALARVNDLLEVAAEQAWDGERLARELRDALPTDAGDTDPALDAVLADVAAEDA